MPGGIRRRKLNKSGASKKVRRRAARKEKKKYVYHNSIIEANWDPKLTVLQNYKKLGLSAGTERATGGTETGVDSAEIKTQGSKTQTARIIRDKEGNTRVEYHEVEDLDAPTKPVPAKTEIVQKLEEIASNRTQTQRYQSENEVEWLKNLMAIHGDDYKAMQWDKKWNKFQHSSGELKRRIKKLLARNSIY